MGFALACLRLSREDFMSMTPAEFSATTEQWGLYEERQAHASWERARLIGYMAVSPYTGKKVREPSDLIRFAWEKENTTKKNGKRHIPTDEDFARVEAYYSNG
jgi:hypothetical protein